MHDSSHRPLWGIAFHNPILMLAVVVGISGAPFQYFFLGVFIIILITIVRSKPSFQEVVSAANSLGNNPMAIIIVVIGCIMTYESKVIGIDSNVGSIIVGYGGGLLQAQVKDQLHSPGSVVNESIQKKVVTPPTDEPTPKDA